MKNSDNIDNVFGNGEGESLPEYFEGDTERTFESSQGEQTEASTAAAGDIIPAENREVIEKKHPGRQFSSTYQPEKSGRKKNVLKHLIGEYDLSSQDVNALHSKLLSLSFEELKRLVADPNTSVIEIAFASGIIRDIKKGHVEVVETMLNRSIGRPDLKIKGMFGYSREAEEAIKKVFDEETADNPQAD